MSRGRGQQLSFASRSAFHALEVDSGEEEEEEVVAIEEQQPAAPVPADAPAPAPVPAPEPTPAVSAPAEASSDAPSKPSKSAQKRAKRLQQQQQAAAPAPPPPGTLENPVEVPSEPDAAAAAGPPVQASGPAAAPVHTLPPPRLGAPDVPLPPVSPRKRRASQDHPAKPPLPKEPKIELGVRASNGDVIGERKLPITVSQPTPDERAKRMRNAGIRTLWTFIMIGGFILLLLMGHVYMILLVMVCQSLVYREVTALFTLGAKDKVSDPEVASDPREAAWSKTFNWYFFAVTNYFLYGETIIYYFKHVVFSDANFLPFALNHRLVSFMLWTMGFVGFVASLKKQYLKQQFGLFCWVHMTLLVVVVSSHFIVNNILEGMIWFWVPASFVICNDIFAYVWGVTLGRTPLFKLSPKKTVEGFVGALFSTIILGVIYGTFFMRFDYMICPAHDLGVSAWSSVKCDPNPVFVWREWTMWPPLRILASSLLGQPVSTIPYAPYQFHCLALACFASLVAPFGGFFASGFKRAFDIKDFGHSIPGHGGMTDRMDCQFLMGMFSYVWYSSLVRQMHVTVGSVLQMIVSGLSPQEQVELFYDLKRYLETSGAPIIG